MLDLRHGGSRCAGAVVAGWAAMWLACGCGQLTREDADSTRDPDGTPAAGGARAGEGGAAGSDGSIGGSTGGGSESVTDPDRPVEGCAVRELTPDCEGCPSVSLRAIDCTDNVLDVAWAGDRLLIAHDDRDQVSLLGITDRVVVEWHHDVPYGAQPSLWADGDRAVLVEATSEDLSVLSETDGFDPAVLPLSDRKEPVGIDGGELHVLQLDSNGSTWRYLRGPVGQHLALTDEFDTPPRFPKNGPLVPFFEETDLATRTATLFVEQARAFTSVTLPGTGSVTDVILADDEIVAVLQPAPTGFIGADLLWSASERHLGTDVAPAFCQDFVVIPFPDICPSDRTYYDPRPDVVLTTQLFLDTRGEVWVAAVAATLTEVCGWATMSGCFETLPCECRQEIATSHIAPQLWLEPVKDPSRSIRIGLPSFVHTFVPLAVHVTEQAVHVAAVDMGTYSSGTIYVADVQME